MTTAAGRNPKENPRITYRLNSQYSTSLYTNPPPDRASDWSQRARLELQAPKPFQPVSDSFEILEHTADIGFRAWGATPAMLFENAARAMGVIAADPNAVEARTELAVEISGDDFESLLVNWLSEIVYLFDSGRFAAKSYQVDEITAEKLTARLIGEPRDPPRHPWRLIVKAVTYHEIEVAERNGRWEARVFLDI